MSIWVMQQEEDRDPWKRHSYALEALRIDLSDNSKQARRSRAHDNIQRVFTTESGGRKTGGGAKPLENESQCPIASLQALCLGVLALHLNELIEYGDQVLPLLPTEAKLSLLSAARRRAELTNTALKLLIDSSMPVLDVHSTNPKVSPSSIIAAARVMAPTLKYVDITGSIVAPRFLLSLAEVAPLIQILRFGGFTAKDPEEMGEALLRILPKLEQTEDSIADSWEEALAEEGPRNFNGGGGSGRDGRLGGAGGGRLMHLRCLTWPEIPYETRILCQNAAPAVCINLSREDMVGRKFFPTEFYSEVELDGEYIKHVAGHETWGLGENPSKNDASASLPVIHIAERFKMAFESQEKRLKKKDERLWRKATREVLSVSGGERAIQEWEYGF